MATRDRVSGPSVREYMTVNPTRIHKDDTIRQAYILMDTEQFRHLPVVDDRENVVGMLSERDLRAYAAGAGAGNSPPGGLAGDRPVRELMSGPVETIAADEDLHAASRMLIDANVGALPVTQDMNSDKLIGILSYVDVLRAFLDEQ